MIDFIKKLFGKNKVDYKALVENGAQIIDVRTPAEFSNGSIRFAKNIPLQELAAEMKKLDLKSPLSPVVQVVCEALLQKLFSSKMVLVLIMAETGSRWKIN